MKCFVCEAQSEPVVFVRWKIPEETGSASAVAAAIAETVLGHLQRAVSATSTPLASAPHAAGDENWKTLQSSTPVGYQEVATQLAGLQWGSGLEELALTTEDGRVIPLSHMTEKLRAHALRSAAMTDNDDVTPKPPRRPARIMRRPGEGGLRRLTSLEFDPNAELDTFGEVLWRVAPGGAVIGVMELDPTGNAVILERISNDDRGERFVDQHRPCLGIAAQYGEDVRPRIAILAGNMSGTREVRPNRAGPPDQGVLERDDILLLDDYINAGWVEAVVWRDPTRIARAVHPGTTIVQRMLDNRIQMYIAYWGKRVDRGDMNRLYQEMVYSAHDRDQLVQKLHTARVTKGPLAGKGHLGPTQLGIVRDRRTRERSDDPVQMEFINLAFKLADESEAGDDMHDNDGLSIRKLAARLTDLGFPISYNQLRSILKNPMYSTGENVATVGGIPIEQEPIKIRNPVPIDRFLRVQEKLALRQGGSSLTPIGAFLFNYVEVLHQQCLQERNRRKLPPRIKGHVKRNKNTGEPERTREYRHAYFTPKQCQRAGRGKLGAFTWERDLLERPVVEEIRKLATHPEVVRALAKAARHTPSETSARLTDEQRERLEREIEQLELEKDAAADDFISALAAGQPAASPGNGLAGQPRPRGFDAYQKFLARFDRQIEQRHRRLERDADARRAETTGKKTDPRHVERQNAFLEIMTLEVPDDPFMRQLRARLFQRIVSRIVIDDDGTPENPIVVTVEGHLVPDDALVGQIDPISASADLLDSYITRQQGKTPEAETLLDKLEEIQTELSAGADSSVSLLPMLEDLPNRNQVLQAKRSRLDSTDRPSRNIHARLLGRVGWSFSIKVVV